MNREVRVRFAPSPTGALHIGGVRTALYNYLFAKKNNGTFILRIEDTDQTRFVPGAEAYINEAFKWLGINPEEGPVAGGGYGPYKQSERKNLYIKYGKKLIDEGNAYYAFDTPEDLEEMRNRLTNTEGANPVYDCMSRMSMKNSLTLTPEEVDTRIANGDPYVVRLKVPEEGQVILSDMIRGEVIVQNAHIDDKILIKSDGMPTYHLANVVDDHLMKISHVIRGEEWLPSAPLHVLLYRFLGWEDTMPLFAHLPLLLKPDGNGKLNKRDADKHGYPVFPLDWIDPRTGDLAIGFREAGYLPETVLNFLSLLGWNPGTEQEFFSLEELIEHFSIERIGKSGSKFDIEKAKWFNQHYIKNINDEVLTGTYLKLLQIENIECTPEKAGEICSLMKERVTFIKEIWTNAPYFFIAPEEYDAKVIKKKWNDEAVEVLKNYKNVLSDVDKLTKDVALSKLEGVLEELNIPLGKIMQALRLALTGVGGGPDLMGIISVLGKNEVISRIEKALSIIRK